MPANKQVVSLSVGVAASWRSSRVSEARVVRRMSRSNLGVWPNEEEKERQQRTMQSHPW